jgi:hypothetical protein
MKLMKKFSPVLLLTATLSMRAMEDNQDRNALNLAIEKKDSSEVARLLTGSPKIATDDSADREAIFNAYMFALLNDDYCLAQLERAKIRPANNDFATSLLTGYLQNIRIEDHNYHVLERYESPLLRPRLTIRSSYESPLLDPQPTIRSSIEACFRYGANVNGTMAEPSQISVWETLRNKKVQPEIHTLTNPMTILLCRITKDNYVQTVLDFNDFNPFSSGIAHRPNPSLYSAFASLIMHHAKMSGNDYLAILKKSNSENLDTGLCRAHLIAHDGRLTCRNAAITEDLADLMCDYNSHTGDPSDPHYAAYKNFKKALVYEVWRFTSPDRYAVYKAFEKFTANPASLYTTIINIIAPLPANNRNEAYQQLQQDPNNQAE